MMDAGGLTSFLMSLDNREDSEDEHEKKNYRASVSTGSRFNLKKSGVLIEGDSLLIHFLAMELGDGNMLIDCDYGASSLHLCYLINQYLEFFFTHGVAVTVVFFNNHSLHLLSNQHYLLLRYVVMKNIAGIDASFRIRVLQFESFQGTDFDMYLSSCMRALSPLELVLFRPEMSINKLYGQVLLNYWGVAVGDIAHCDLVGASEIRDVVREDRVRANLTLQVHLGAADTRSKRYKNEDCCDIDAILFPSSNSTSFVVESEDERESTESQQSSEQDILISDLPQPLCFTNEDLTRIYCDPLISFLSCLSALYPELATFAQSHIETVHILSSTHPKDRSQFYLAQSKLTLKSERIDDFKLYCRIFAEAVVSSKTVQKVNDTTVSVVGLNNASLFIGDIWDGRLLLYVHLQRHSEDGDLDEEDSDSQFKNEFGTPFAITGTLVDNVIGKARDNFSDVAHLHTSSYSYSDNSSAHRGIGGDMPSDMHTHNLRSLDALPPRQYDARNFYRACGFDFFDQHDQLPHNKVSFVNIVQETCALKLVAGDETVSVKSDNESTQELQTTSGIEDSVEDELKHQKVANSHEISDFKASGQTQREAVMKGKDFSPLGPAKSGWQSLYIHERTKFNLLKPRYNTVTNSSDLETLLADRYFFEDGFRPEPWQLIMLQKIEENKSILIMAPTSSGKTLAAKYAMRKVCHENLSIEDISKKGRGIFVQPTNALVNQTFGSFLEDKHVGIDKVAMFTAESRSPNFNDGSYEVLITNPQCLLILLTSGHSKSSEGYCFYERLRAVVFDEVHSIGQDVGSDPSSGVIWEQLLATIDCPVIGLSATLADAEPFYQWLCSTKEQQMRNRVVSGQSIPWNCTVERLEHFERSTPLHYFSKLLNDSDGKVVLDPWKPVNVDNLQFEGGSSLNVNGIVDNNTSSASASSSWPIEKITLSWTCEVLSSCDIRLQFSDDSSSTSLKYEVTVSMQIMCEKTQQYRIAFTTNAEDQSVAKSALFIQSNSDACRMKLSLYFSDGELKFIANSIDANGEVIVKLKYQSKVVFFAMNKLRITSRGVNVTIQNFSIKPVIEGDIVRHTVTLWKRNLQINPLQFLPSFDHRVDSQLAGFFESVPHVKLADIHDLVTAMQSSLVIKKFTDVLELSKYRSSYLGGDIEVTYNRLRDLVFGYLARLEPTNVDDLLQYAQFRLDFNDAIIKMHKAVLQLPTLHDRLFVDALFAYSLQKAGIDWYGYQWLAEFSYLDALHEAEILLRQDLQNCDPLSIVEYSMRKVTSCTFANDIENAVEDIRDLFCIYPSSVTAVNRSVYYFLRLLLKLDDCCNNMQLTEEAQQVEKACSIVSEEDDEKADGLLANETTNAANAASTANQLHDEIISILKPKNGLRSDGKDKFKSNIVAKLLGEMVASSCEHIGPMNTISTILADGKKSNFSLNQVQQPTLIFHLDKQMLDRFVEELVGEGLLKVWFGSAQNIDCFLTQAEVTEIMSLPHTSEKRKLALRYGIGLHNAVVKESSQYRKTVEKLFQNKKLLFVFATTSLSYGINMPCSKVVFLGDSPHLSNMVFRQSSGRAGRRGYMSGAGHIYFVGFTQLSIIRKLCTPIDSLTPRQALSPAYILKMTSISATCHESNHQWVDHMTLQGLMNPLFEQLLVDREDIRTHFRTALLNSIYFSWSFLAERGYINGAGVAQVKASLPYRVHYLEPRCFLLAELFDSFLNPDNSEQSEGLLGLIRDDIVVDADGAITDSQKQVELDLHIFMVLVYFASFSFVASSDSRACSYQLPHCIVQAWNRYNQEVMRSLVGFMRFYSANIAEEKYPLNPGAFQSYKQPVSSPSAAAAEVPIVAARSCFTVPSGLGDRFLSIQEMLLSVKKGMIIDSRLIPSSDIECSVNTTLFTTFQDGRLNTSDRDAETTCESFSRNLRGVVTQLEHMFNALSEPPSTNSKPYQLMQSFRRVRNKFLYQFKRAKKCQFCTMRRGIVSSVSDQNKCTVHFLDESSDELHFVDAFSAFQMDKVWEVGDCVQFYEDQKLNSRQVIYMEHLRSKTGRKITAIAYQGRIVRIHDDSKEGLVNFLPTADGHDDNGSALTPPTKFFMTSSFRTMTNHIIDLLYSPHVYSPSFRKRLKNYGFAVQLSRLVGIAAKVKSSNTVDSIYFLRKEGNELKLLYAIVPFVDGKRMKEGDIVEFSQRGKDYQPFNIVPVQNITRARIIDAELHNSDNIRRPSHVDSTFPAEFICYGDNNSISQKRSKKFRFMYSPFVSGDYQLCFYIPKHWS